jgi:hypothetical protein
MFEFKSNNIRKFKKSFISAVILTVLVGLSMIFPRNVLAGPTGTVLSFDGNDYLVATDNAVFDQPNTFSLGVWIKPSNASTAGEYIIYRSGSYYIERTTPDIIVGAIWYGAAWHTVTSTNATAASGVWTHIEMTYDKDAGGSDELKLYLNGILAGSGDNSTAIPDSSSDLYLGSDSTPANYYSGKMDDFSFYPYALTGDEVRVDYNSGFAILLAPTDKTCAQDPASCVNNGLVGYWNMDEGGASTAKDSSGNGNNGVLTNGPLWTKGKKGNALKFDGVDDYIKVNDSENLSAITNITFSGWFKFNNISTTRTFIRKGSEGGSDITWLWYWIGIGENANNISFFTPSGETFASFIPIVGQWYYISTVIDSSNNAKHYINGVLLANSAGSMAPFWVDDADPLIIGDWSTYDYNGTIDEVRIYNRALSFEEINYLYNEKKPVIQWDLDEGAGTTARDLQGNLDITFPGDTANHPTWVKP